jgi:hypothetical protein
MEPGSPTVADRRPAAGSNGGFPEPPAGMPVRVVRAAHDACGAVTRVRLPAPVPARAVRRVVCDRCARPFACEAVEVTATPEAARKAPPPRPSRVRRLLDGLRDRQPLWFDLPPGRLWKLVSIPLAAAAVIVGLLLIQGSDDPMPESRSAATSRGSAGPGDAELVSQPGWSLALPDGWRQLGGPTGAAFAAVSEDGSGDATLWIERDPSLSFAEFEARSLDQLRQLTGTAGVIERSAGPTPEKTVVRLQADAPPGSGTFAPYTVTLRVAGPYRYYLSTSLQPGAPREADDAIELIHNSFLPQPGETPTETSKTPATPGAEVAPPQTEENP